MTADEQLRIIELAGGITGGVLLPVFFWWNGRRDKKRKAELAEAVKQAHDEGVVSAQGEQSRAATKALHDRLDEYRERIEDLEKANRRMELLLAGAGIFVPEGSQVGPDGRGVRNPLRDPP
jgi:hypothetical protein